MNFNALYIDHTLEGDSSSGKQKFQKICKSRREKRGKRKVFSIEA